MIKMKSNKKYYFTVEGETENWYMQWLKKQINSEITATHTVTFDCTIQKNPLKRAKSLVITSKTVITHICDYESNEPMHTKQFLNTLDLMKESQSIGKQIKYKLGYSNFTFELWIILHKMDCSKPLTNRKDYLTFINQAYDESFEKLSQYKEEDNFKRILSKITLNNVKEAIARSKNIMQRNAENGSTLSQYKTYKYYKENPALTIWESIEKNI